MKCAFRGKVLTAAAGEASLRWLDDGVLELGEDGRIEAVRPWTGSAAGRVVRDVRPFRGRPYATVSAGHEAGVRRGMRLGLADPRTGAPAGCHITGAPGAAGTR